jgi:hypothetical protein
VNLVRVDSQAFSEERLGLLTIATL